MRQRDYNSASFSPNGCGCLVLLMCIGLMTAIVLPSFLNQAGKAKQSEGKQYISLMNRGQQAYFAEKSAFATSVNALGLGIKTETTNYKYLTRATKTAAFNYGVSKQKKEKSFVGGVFLVPAYPNAPKDEMTTTSILCEADSPGTIKPVEPTYQNGKIACGKDTTQVTR
jgi:type IV pilus assembly protein PilA